jgi:hypothetical protein
MLILASLGVCSTDVEAISPTALILVEELRPCPPTICDHTDADPTVQFGQRYITHTIQIYFTPVAMAVNGYD